MKKLLLQKIFTWKEKYLIDNYLYETLSAISNEYQVINNFKKRLKVSKRREIWYRCSYMLSDFSIFLFI